MSAVVEVALTNTTAYILEAPEDCYEELSKFWSFSPPGAYFAPAYQIWIKAKKRKENDSGRPLTEQEITNLPGWDGKIRMFKNGELPSGLFRATRQEAELKLGVKFSIEYRLPKQVPLVEGFESNDPKYYFQNECVEAMCKSLRRGGGIVLAATRVGKTRTAAQFFSKLTCPCLFVVDQLDLLDQNRTEIESALGEKVGYVGASVFDPARVTVATIQTLSKHRKKSKFQSWYASIQVVVIDELHEAMGRRNFQVCSAINPIARYGLTATLELGKKPVRYKAYSFVGPVIYRYPVQQGIEEGVLTEGRILQLAFGIQRPMGVTTEDRRNTQVLDNEVKHLACRRIIDHVTGTGKYVLALVDRIAHIDTISDVLHDIPHSVACGRVKKDIRRRMRKKFDKGKINCILANRVFKKGITLSRVDIMLDMAELPSRNDAIQKFGRGLGLHPNKAEFVYIDFTTQGTNKLAIAGRARLRAWKKEGISTKVVKIKSAKSALIAVKRFLAEAPCQKIATQTTMFG